MLDRPSSPSAKDTHRDVLTIASSQKEDGRESDTRARAPKPDKPDEPPADGKENQAKDGAEEGKAEDSHGSIEGGRRFIRKHPIGVAIGVVILIAAVIAGTLYYLHARNFESTDDAFIDGRPVSISPEVTGNIVEVPVTDNQVVKAGDVLARIDDRDYRAAVANADAQIAQAEASIGNYNAQIGAQQAQIEQTKKQVAEAQAALDFSRTENTRYQDLVKTGAGTVQRAQQSASDLQQKQAQLASSQASQLEAERQIGVLIAQVKTATAQRGQAIAQKTQAEANLSRTILHATIDGRVTRLTGAVGQVATSQSSLMVLVPLNVWVTANFKETQLALMRVGQPVSIEVDAFGRTFPGHVDSIQAGSGTAFSLLPAENATGNYVKVVQRVPVKITFDQQPDVELGPGMSVVPTVTVR